MPSIALFRHFFYLRKGSSLCYGCASFIAVNNSNAISRTGKKVEGFLHKWIFKDVRRSHARLELLTPLDRWAHEKLTDPRKERLLENITADLKAEKLTVSASSAP